MARLADDLGEALTQHGCSSADVEGARALWRGFVETHGAKELSGTAASWWGALHYLVMVLSGRRITQKDVAALYRIPASTLSTRVKSLKASTDQTAPGGGMGRVETMRPRGARGRGRPSMAVPGARDALAAAQELQPPTTSIFPDDAVWIDLFRETHRLLSVVYGERTHVEILRYLAHVELNLVLAGYRVSRQVVQDQFAKLFPRLHLEPAKGRDPRKFVYLHDVFGREEPFVLLRLGDEHG